MADDPQQPRSLKLIYFDFGGRAEAVRLALHVGGVAFEDVRITEAEFKQQKDAGKYPFGSVPVLEVDGVTYAQSVGILRYVGRLGGLYPEQPLEAGLAVDQIVGGVEDMIVATVPFLFAGETEKPAMKEKLEQDVYPRFFAAFSALLQAAHGDGFFCGKQLTIADLAVYPVLQWITTSITSPAALGPYPLLSQWMERTGADPRVRGYFALERQRKQQQQQQQQQSQQQQQQQSSEGGAGAGAV